MAVPVFRRVTAGQGSRTLAVIQMINKMEFDGEIGKFDDEDVQVMETFATFVGSKLEQSSLLNSAQTCQSEAGKAFDLTQQKRGQNSLKQYEATHRNGGIAESFAEDEEGDET